jgi:CHAT domain-containing protein
MRAKPCFFLAAFSAVLMFPLPGGIADQSTISPSFDSFSARLDEALGAGSREHAYELVLDDLDGADSLFLKYLAETIDQERQKEGPIPQLVKAYRLADIFFRIFEFDFEKGVLSFWGKESPARKRELMPIFRDHFATYREARRRSRQMPQPIDKNIWLRNEAMALADRYRRASFGKGELQALLLASSLNIGPSWPAWELAKSLSDEVGEAWAAYHCGFELAEGQAEFGARHAVEAAERLHLPRLLQFALIRQAWRALSRDDYASHIRYLRQGLEIVRKIPVRQILANRSGHSYYPGEAWYLKTLWRAYELNRLPAAQDFFEQGRAMSRLYGGEVGELAYLIAAMQQYIRPGVFATVAADAERLARRMNDPGWLAVFLMTKAGGFEGTREFPKAFATIEEAASIFQKMGSRSHFAECLLQRATFRVQTDDLAGALADYEDALKILDELGFTEYARVWRVDAAVALKAHPKWALKFVDKILDEGLKKGDAGVIRTAFSTRALVLAIDSPAESLEDNKRALFYAELHQKNIGYPGEVPVSMRLVSQALRAMGKYAEAVQMEKRRAEFARAEGLYNVEADTYYWLSAIHSLDLGEPAIAAEYAEKYFGLMIRPGRRLTVNNCDRIAGAYLSIGQPARALEFWAKALELAKETPAGEHFERMVHANMARINLELGDYDSTISELEEESALIESTFQVYKNPNIRIGYELEDFKAAISPLEARDALIERAFQAYRDPIEIQKAGWFNKMALAHVLSGNLPRAAEESRQAIQLESGTPPGTTPAQYFSYFTPGDALALAGELDEAIAFYKERRDRAREIKSLTKERESLLQLGSLYERSREFPRARQSLYDAIRIDRTPPVPRLGSLSESLLALGKLELRAGNLPQAEEHLVEARQTANPYDLDQLWQVERALAVVSAGRKRFDLAADHFELALSALEGARERLRPEEFALRFGTDRLQVYDEYASFLAGRAIEIGDPACAEKALLVVERRRAEALRELMALGWTRLHPDAVPEQLRRVRDVEARLAAKQGILRDQFTLAPEKRNHTLISQLEADLKLTKEEHAHLLTALAQGNFRFSSPSAFPRELLAKVRRGLGPNRVLVEYLVTDDSAYAFVLSSVGLKSILLPVGRQKLRSQVQELLRPFYRLRTGELDLVRIGFDFRAAHDLYEQLIAPIESLIGQNTQVLIVPDDVLYYLPLELLVDGLPGKEPTDGRLFSECEQAGFLVRRYTIGYLTAAAQIAGGPEASSRPLEAETLLALSNPAARQDAGVPSQEDPLSRRLHSASYGWAFLPPPGSSDEIARIQGLFPPANVTVLTGSRATETNYKALSPRSGIIHLATHAIAADDQPFYSTLVLTPDGKAREDGFLQAYEIVRSSLRARLIVLSACETASGPLGRGEGLVGLVSAFLQAGARSVLATQWSIDESTAELMTSFYEALTEGKSQAEALRQAKLDIMKKRLRFAGTEVSLAHPVFWAPFVLIGSGD